MNEAIRIMLSESPDSTRESVMCRYEVPPLDSQTTSDGQSTVRFSAAAIGSRHVGFDPLRIYRLEMIFANLGGGNVSILGGVPTNLPLLVWGCITRI